MQRLIELLTEFPTVMFTAVLIFCLAWWVISLVVSGVDGSGDVDVDADVDLDVDADLDVNGSDHAHPVSIGRVLQLGTLPLSLAFTILAAVAWSVSLLLQLVLDSFSTSAALGVVLGIVVALFAVAVGVKTLAAVAKPAARVFVSESAPERAASVGSTCKIRTTHVTGAFGDAEVLTGPTKGSLIRVRTSTGDFQRGDIALVIAFDESSESFTITELDASLAP
jgi:uncharacterized membrane protein